MMIVLNDDQLRRKSTFVSSRLQWPAPFTFRRMLKIRLVKKDNQAVITFVKNDEPCLRLGLHNPREQMFSSNFKRCQPLYSVQTGTRALFRVT